MRYYFCHDGHLEAFLFDASKIKQPCLMVRCQEHCNLEPLNFLSDPDDRTKYLFRSMKRIEYNQRGIYFEVISLRRITSSQLFI